jgi:hypothetical protein
MSRINALYSSYPVDSKKYRLDQEVSRETATANVHNVDRATISPEGLWLAAMPLNAAEAEIANLNTPAQLVYNRRSLSLKR